MAIRINLNESAVIRFSVAIATALFLTLLFASLMRSTSHLRSLAVKPQQKEDMYIRDLFSLDPVRRYASSLHFQEITSDGYFVVKNVDNYGGNFVCKESDYERACVISVTSIKEAKKICRRYEQCIGFLLTTDMVVHLKNSLTALVISDSSSLFVVKRMRPELEKQLTKLTAYRERQANPP